MGVAEEIHQIKGQLTDLSKTVNGLVRSIGNVRVVENQQKNDKETINNLASEVDKLADVINELNTNIATMNGVARGKRTMWTIFGGLICLSIVGMVSTVIIHNSKIDVCGSEIKTLKAKIKTLEERK